MKKIIPMSNMEFIRNALTVPTKRSSIFKNPFGDSDRDKVPNYRDCAPLNPRKHGVEPSRLMAQKYRKLPIFVSRSDIPEEEEYYHFMSKEARKEVPKARAEVLGMLKRAPSLIGEIKRKRPHIIGITSEPSELGYVGRAYAQTYDIFMRGIPEESEKYLREQGIKKPLSVARAGVLRHELEHIHQYRKTRAKKGTRYIVREHRKPYEEQPSEKSAYRKQAHYRTKLIKEPTEEEVAEKFKETFKNDQKENQKTN